ncbi:hypothetical protein DAPPUDRAFT_271833 [Daphnia pulex]|uniref:Uncharacterized protein n=1 Tax=Daphnia pulex TaxID=6669 RepID=E9I2J2_DAPPU|nr:hypothetical protein DAPPUDRAFT_271833 [Daphnia pulex]|eukprot:EFX61789.1 hypothetical protein DAPPUDRAFT_271833 [Daphnia pulex]
MLNVPRYKVTKCDNTEMMTLTYVKRWWYCDGQPDSPRRVRWGFRKMIPAIVPYLAP